MPKDANGGSGSETTGAEKNLHKMSKQLINQPVNCPWTSRAPTGGVRNLLFKEKTSTTLQVNHFPHSHESSSQFFHFLRLMQLFPDVHPATLHTVMVLCKNNFFAAVHRLLHAKRCKNFLTQRRNHWIAYNANRINQQSFTPPQTGYVRVKINRQFNSTSVPNSNIEEENFLGRSAESGRLLYGSRSRAPPKCTDLQKYVVPIRPLSPVLSENDNKN